MTSRTKSSYPLKFVRATKWQQLKMHYIPMPGQHGSGSQCLTSPVGLVAKHLIANFLRKRGTVFPFLEPTPLEMCEYFALIHRDNRMLDGKTREIWDDGGYAKEHASANEKLGSTSKRAEAVKIRPTTRLNYSPLCSTMTGR